MDYEEEVALRRAVRWAVDIATVIALAWFLVYSFGTHAVNAGQSMRPALENGDRVLLNRPAVKLFGARRFDIVLFRLPDGTGESVKRIIGLPGETVQILEGTVLIDGREPEQPCWLPDEMISVAGRAEEPVKLGADEYFVLSDKRDAGQDSRFESVGNIRRDMIVGKVWFRTAPFSGIGGVR